ncbi:uncharacterized protein BDV14DRAFT_200114 [Aspergillus stella-maris]|uniref:uncharacterized protein n=1 Tax=Aspergillus stella-maris TaxID=1810926 RepID=UPI003CCCEF2F
MQYFNFKAVILMLGIITTAMAAAANHPAASNHPAAKSNTGNEINLAELNTDLNVTSTSTSTNSTLARREWIHACQQWRGLQNECKTIPYIDAFVERLSKMIIIHSDNKDCSKITKVINDVKIEYYGTGLGCHTEAHADEIYEAVYKLYHDRPYYRDVICGRKCLRLRHAGQWNGYVKLAHKSLG